MNKFMIITLYVLGWLTPLIPFFIMAGIAIGFDTYYGQKVAKKLGNNDPDAFAKVLKKIFLYNCIIVSGHMLDVYLLADFVVLVSTVPLAATKAIVFAVLYIELNSIDAKLNKLYKRGIWGSLKSVVTGFKKGHKTITEITDHSANDNNEENLG